MSARALKTGFMLAAILYGAALAAYGVGAYHAPLLDSRAAARQSVVVSHARTATVDVAREAELAAAYWRRYPDVAHDPFFGASGTLGVFGAREHYDRHGREEGRKWGP